MSIERPLISEAGEPIEAVTAAHDIEAARSAIANWLLHSGAQQVTGENAGAVAGWLAPSGRADYVYPEITGYYLQWLAWYALRHDASADVAHRASAAQHWLQAWVSRDSLPQTRVYLRDHQDDWRNRALFFFDVAMVLRGLAWSVHAGLISADTALVDRLCALLRRLMRGDGMFDACVLESTADSNATLPSRWSTQRGPFLAKAAEGVLCAARWLPNIAEDIVRAAESTFDASLNAALVSPHHETHPFLYALEGVFNRAATGTTTNEKPRLAAQFDALMHQVDGVGHLPEASDRAGAKRLDIVAQAIRIDSILHSQLGHEGDHNRKSVLKMVGLLVENTNRAGALPFAPDQQPVQLNVWTAMFAEQALARVQYRLFDRNRAVSWTHPCLI